MTRLPDIQLDDRRFQDLVSEARMRIARSCPEWTDHNVSDPGITLIELFAWMTEMTIYRLNRVPEKIHVALLNLLGIHLGLPSAARTGLRFRLAAPPTEALTIPGGAAEVGTRRTATEDSIVFQVDEDFTIQPMVPAAYVLTRGGSMQDVGIAQGTARPQGADQLAFASPPAVGDALCLGFDGPIGRLVLQVAIEASQARGAGVTPEDPPLRWEASQPDGSWAECEVLEDSTGGFNLGSGRVVVQVPPDSGVAPLAGHRDHWLRCRISETTRSGATGASYAVPPEIYSITAAPVGAMLPATHASLIRDEHIGVSDGTPGQTFRLAARPVLKLAERETLEVQDPETGSWSTWREVESFAASSPADLHFMLDAVGGEVALGPAIRQADGGWTQAGAIPPKGAILKVTRYRHGGGLRGNVAAGSLNVLRTPLPGVDVVTNPAPALGGVDPEPIDHARRRAGMEIRSRSRAVTADDFEFLAQEASPRVARAVCVAPTDGGPIPVHLLPKVQQPDRLIPWSELQPDESLLSEVAEYLDERRLIGTNVRLLPCRLRGISIVVSVAPAPLVDPARVERDVQHALETYLNPYIGGSQGGPGQGWPLGRPLNQGELYGIVHAVSGVAFVHWLRIYETDLETNRQAPEPAGTHVVLEPDELIASGRHIVRVVRSEDG